MIRKTHEEMLDAARKRNAHIKNIWAGKSDHEKNELRIKIGADVARRKRWADVAESNIKLKGN